MNRKASNLIWIVACLTAPALASADDWLPFWSRGSHGFPVSDSAASHASFTIAGPDGQSQLLSAEGKVQLVRHGKPVADLTDATGSLGLVEAGWSGDGEAVFVNASDGGDSGPWTTHVFVFNGDAVHEVAVDKTIAAASKLHSDCLRNIGAVAWLNGHAQLLVVEQVPDTEGCSDRGSEAGYVIDLAQAKVARSLSAKDLKAGYDKELGELARGGGDKAAKPKPPARH